MVALGNTTLELAGSCDYLSAKIVRSIDPVNIVDIQIGQEQEKLEQMKDEFDEEGKDNMYEFADALMREWLPELAAEFKRSYGHRR